jgi:hemerythrin-like domain-containing protein
MNVIDRLMKDHERFRAWLSELDVEVLESHDKYSPGWTEEAGAKSLAVLAQLVPAMERHERAERRVLYPELVRHAPEARMALEKMTAQHASLDRLVEGFLKQLPKAGEHPTAWMLKNVIELCNTLEKHLWQEEDDLFDLARQKIPAEELERLDRQAEPMLSATKQKATS